MKLNPFKHSEGRNEIRAQSLVVIYTVKNMESMLKNIFPDAVIFEIHVTGKQGNTSFRSVIGHDAEVYSTHTTHDWTQLLSVYHVIYTHVEYCTCF